MTEINRREMIAGAAAVLGGTQLPRVFAASLLDGAGLAAGAGEDLPIKPRNLLSTTFTPSVLSQALASSAAWHPFPKADEREAWQRLPKDVSDGILKRGEAALGAPWESLPATVFLDFHRDGNRSRYEALNFGRRARLSNLVLAECVENKSRFLDEITNGVWLVCEETFWGVPAHLGLQKAGTGLPDVSEPVVDLFAAQTSATLSWTYYFLSKQLEQVSPLVPKRILIEAKRRTLNPAFDRDDFWWMWKGNEGTGSRLNNWNPWINSNLLLTNLLLEQDAERRVKAIAKVCKSVDAFLDDYSADAACEEGPGYWGESAAAYFDCCSLLISATRGTKNVLAEPFVRKMMHYIADVHIADHFSVNYGDASARAGTPGQLAWIIGDVTGDKALQKFGTFYMPPPNAEADGRRGGGGQGSLTNRSLLSIFSMEKARSGEKADALGRDSWYPSLALMTARAKADSTDGFYLAVQATQNQRSHGHNDSGSFIVFHDGTPVFVDAGTAQYTAQTFSKDRYKIWYMQSAYHNLPTVGGVMQTTGDAKFRASEIKYFNDDAHAGMSMNLGTAYPAEAGITRWMRTTTLDRKTGSIVFNEDFQLNKKVSVALSFITPRTPSQGAGGSLILASTESGAKDVTLKFDPSIITATIEKIDVTDQGMKMTWGQLYRVLLTSSEPVDAGKWKIEAV